MQDEDIVALSALCARHDIFLIGDEVYEHMVFDQCKHLSLCAYADLYARSFVISSLRQDISCDRLESRLLRRSTPAHSGVQTSPPVRDVHGEHTCAVGYR